MDRSSMCARPGCQGPAAAWLTYAYGSSQVWLDDQGDEGGDRWPLCRSHAERLKVPRGWSQVDRRLGEDEAPARHGEVLQSAELMRSAEAHQAPRALAS